jgi:hypothetical protein
MCTVLAAAVLFTTDQSIALTRHLTSRDLQSLGEESYDRFCIEDPLTAFGNELLSVIDMTDLKVKIENARKAHIELGNILHHLTFAFKDYMFYVRLGKPFADAGFFDFLNQFPLSTRLRNDIEFIRKGFFGAEEIFRAEVARTFPFFKDDPAAFLDFIVSKFCYFGRIEISLYFLSEHYMQCNLASAQLMRREPSSSFLLRGNMIHCRSKVFLQESNELHIENLLELSAALGLVNVFRSLMHYEGNALLKTRFESIMRFAVFGGNAEIIALCGQSKKFRFCHSCFIMAFQCSRLDVVRWMLGRQSNYEGFIIGEIPLLLMYLDGGILSNEKISFTIDLLRIYLREIPDPIEKVGSYAPPNDDRRCLIFEPDDRSYSHPRTLFSIVIRTCIPSLEKFIGEVCRRRKYEARIAPADI